MARNMTRRKLRRPWGRHSSSWPIIRQIAECDSQATAAAKNATCPFWVIRVISIDAPSRPLHPIKQTFSTMTRASASCHNQLARASAPAGSARDMVWPVPLRNEAAHCADDSRLANLSELKSVKQRTYISDSTLRRPSQAE